MQFNEIIGQHKSKAILRAMVHNDHLPHAQLFLGPPGSGKLALALAFAQYVLCEERGLEEACGQCPNCNKAAKWIHPDIHFSFPTIGSKVTSNQFLEHWRSALHDSPYLNINQWFQLIGAENKQGNINKDECMRIIHQLSLKTFEAQYKVLLMWMPEYLGKEGNRLLKLIEEPPEHTLFLLVGENPDKILNTILSRCQLLKIPALPDDQIIAGLQAKHAVSEAQAKTAAHMANGDFYEAMQAVQQTSNDHAIHFVDWLRKAYRGNGVELVKWSEKFAGSGREYQKHFLQYGLHFLRELLQLKIIDTAEVRLAAVELTAATKLKAVINFQQLEQITSLLNDCSYYVERNANPKILFLDASIQINQILKQPAPSSLTT